MGFAPEAFAFQMHSVDCPQLTPLKYLSTPGLWFGLLFATAFVFGAVRLRAFGTYAIRIKDPAVFLREVVGTDGHFTVDEISDQLRNIIVARFGTIVAGSGIPVLDLAANYDQLGTFVLGRIAPEFANYGLELTTILVDQPHRRRVRPERCQPVFNHDRGNFFGPRGTRELAR